MSRSLLFVCLGNICRSPIFEYVCRTHLGELMHVQSAAILDTHYGESADPRAVDIAMTRGYDLRLHRATPIDTLDLELFDLILPMDRRNLQYLRSHLPERLHERLHLVMNLAVSPAEEVADPYYGGPEDFNRVIDQAERLVQALKHV